MEKNSESISKAEAMYRRKHLRLRLVEVDEDGKETGFMISSSCLHADMDGGVVRSVPVEELLADQIQASCYRRLLDEHGFQEFGPVAIER